ncbi:Putative nucleoporin interacting component Nup93/Nic96 [Septoria linicola]|uniref:Nuclear pore protein n=1 Tax=Septoria linicola TaxID=215465 RepID=A0A9Q9B2Q7_9PEZI|nr:putative nucleoporin interacting component Nup93/Nic96 [Septoria linicola]USW55271.1 Putative nucleoporin interacting component Nup93/Nic96 [Septoria linicola]
MALADSTQGAPAYFQALLDRGQKRPNNSDEPQLQLQLGLGDIARKVRNLGKGFTDAKAHYLLAASGVNTSEALRDLEELSGSRLAPAPAPRAAQPTDPATNGVKELLAQRYQSDFQQLVDGHVQRAHDAFDKMIEERLHGVDWDAHRQRIYEHFGLKKPQNLGDGSTNQPPAAGQSSFGRSSRRGGGRTSTASKFGLSRMNKSVIGAVSQRGYRGSAFGDVAERGSDGIRPAPEDNLLRKKQEKYSDQVKDLNVARIQAKNYAIFTRFAEAEGEPTGDDNSMLVNAYKALIETVGEDDTVQNLSEPGAIKERTFAKAYLDDGPHSTDQTAIRGRIIRGSRKFLERLFHSQLEAVVAKNPVDAAMGGVPDPLSRVKGFVRVREKRKELGPDLNVLQRIGEGDYCWAIIFYLLRSGLCKEALEYVNTNAAAFRQLDRQFPRYIRAFAESDDNRLPSDLQTSIANEYSQRQRLAPEDSIDPYRMMCYKVIGRCELGRRSLDGITNDMMDWLWLQFILAREYNRVDEFAHEAFGLTEVQASIKEIGERYFGAGSDIANAPTTLFFMQILAGLYEKAVADLYAHNYLSAVHFAIGLDYYGLLRVSDISNSDDLLSYTTRQEAQIAFGSMIGLYTRDFRTANATAAVDYISLICLNADLTGDLGKAQKDLCYQALTEVVLETREFAQLLGDIRADGQRIKGAIEQRLTLIKLNNDREFLKHVTLVAARTAEEQGRTTDAALLYHLSEDYNKVLAVVNDSLSLALTTELGDTPARLMPLKPRNVNSYDNQDPAQMQASLSLTSIDDPIQLASDIKSLYNSDAMYLNKIDRKYSDACEVLLQLAKARKELEAGHWAQVIDAVAAAEVIPTDTNGDISAIRSKAQAFELMPTSVGRTIGHVMVWTVIACSNEAEKIRSQEFETGARREIIARCVQKAKDVMVFAGLIRYKLPGRVWETLARAGQDLGAY